MVKIARVSPIRKYNVNICNNMFQDCLKYLTNLEIENMYFYSKTPKNNL